MSVRPLPDGLAMIAYTELNEDPKRVEDDLRHIKEWLSKQNHLRARSDDQWLLAFLRGCKFSLERTKEKIDKYYSIRNIAPDCFRIKYSDSAFNEILETGSYLVLPRVDHDAAPRVIIIRPGSYDPDKFTITDIISVADVIHKILLMEDDNTVIAGSRIIFDLNSVKLGHYLQMTLTTMKKMVTLAQDAIPVRVKGIHYLNTPPGFESILNALKSLLNEKHRKRLFVHNKNYDEMYKSIPKDILPFEYNGESENIEDIINYWKKKVQEYSEVFKEDLQYGVDESARSGRAETADAMFGANGSFRRFFVKMPVRALSPELAEKARNELNETDDNKLADSLQHLKEWLAKQPHLKARTDDQWLAAFLRGCKFSLERTKQKIDLFYTLKTTAPELTPLKYNDPKFVELLDLGVTVVLPKSSNPAGPRIILARPGLYDPSKYSIGEVMSLNAVIQNIMLMDDDNFVVAGGVNIMDLQGITMAHFTQINPVLMKKMSVGLQEAAPIRMKGGHYVNTPSFFETIYNFMKSFLNEKNKKRLYVHTDLESLYQHVPKEVLPTEYGGNAGTIRELADNLKKKILEYSAWLDEEHLYGTDESKRPGKPKTAEELFGVEGSFRQLQFD
ncbi:PREDICTED: uncharacterized protein LOC106099464 [Papilio polytes]|uniref:uncharacterized protein LOC106099464 n=1 Tax=Papilio polytes TaxID=76194 RepID=UPI00067689DA|nr:PREDICTED: uncharacterized protein LOC106099464 [Papilio polytes]